MRATRHHRFFLTRCTYTTLTSFLAWSIVTVVPPSVLAGELPLGVATGSKEAQLAVDGKQWASLASSSNPLYDGTMIRTGKGTASVMLKDGTQLELQSHTLIGVSGSRTAPVVKIAAGRIFFRVPVTSQAVLATPSVRYQAKVSNPPAGAAVVRASVSASPLPDHVGEIAVNAGGGSRIALRQGEMLAGSVNDPGMHIIKANQSVYIPQIGGRDASFSMMLAQVLPGEPAPSGVPAGASPAYGLDGNSVGYIIADGSFISSPGITPDLPNPIPLDTIPSDAYIPPGATPIFTTHSPPVFAGYILNNRFIAYLPSSGDRLAGTAARTGGMGVGTGTVVGTLVTVGVIGAGIGLGVAFSGDNNANASTFIPSE